MDNDSRKVAKARRTRTVAGMAMLDLIDDDLGLDDDGPDLTETGSWGDPLDPDSDPRDHTALVIVDVQLGNVTPSTRHIVEPVVALAKKWSDDGRLVFLMTREREYETRNLHLVGGRRNGWESDLIQGLDDLSGYMVHRLSRKGYSALTPDLRTYLDTYVVGQVRLCGIDTERSVLASALALLDGGFDPTVIADLCASTGGDDPHQSGLSNLKRVLGASRVAGYTID